jgi:UDP:flavonoid glycosyltransferase YjiC (YdhE family)
MAEKARSIGAAMQQEDGVATAVRLIEDCGSRIGAGNQSRLGS